jgi:hypothetical protein
VLGAAVLVLLLAGGCASPAERDGTAAATTAPTTSNPTVTSQDTEALRRVQLEVERLCMTEFPEHCAGVALVLGQKVAAIEVEPLGKSPGPEELAELAAGLGIPGLDLSGRARLVVYRRPLAALDAAVRQRFPDLAADLRFADARYSFKYLDALGRRILTEQAGNGINISEVSPEFDGSGVQVVTRTPAAPAGSSSGGTGRP